MALQVPLGWLSEYVELQEAPEALAERLTVAGLEVEEIEVIGSDWDPEKLLVAEVLEVKPHPDADQLSLATVRYQEGQTLTIVSGAPNLRSYEGQSLQQPLKVALALCGATFNDPSQKDPTPITLEAREIRGIASEGMLCSEKELGLSDRHEGILFLDPEAPIGESLQSYLSESILHFDIKGGFSYLMAITGIAREVAALYSQPIKESARTILDREAQAVNAADFIELEVSDPDICSRYSAVLIKNIEVKESPFWMQQCLIHAGMRPINNIVDITNYVMLELGQPLHAFDYDQLTARVGGSAPKITIRRAKAGEQMQTLDGIDRTFDEEMLLITDSKGPIAIAGLMGGEETEVSETTTNVLLESAHFEFLNNRRTSQILKLRTEASDRFGKQLDPELALKASMRAVELMERYASGVVESPYVEVNHYEVEPLVITLDPNDVHRLLGVAISQEQVIETLESLEFRVEVSDVLKVTVPSYRKDINIAADLVEEVARIYGYDRMTPTRLEEELPPQRPNPQIAITDHIRDVLVANGLSEVITYSISNLDDEALWVGQEQLDTPFVPLKNPLSQERRGLRRVLLPAALRAAQQNLYHTPRVALFEVGNVFIPQENQTLPQEVLRLSLVMTGQRAFSSWHSEGEKASIDFYDFKGVMESLLNSLHLDSVTWSAHSDSPSYHPGRCAQLAYQGKVLGVGGELHPRVRQLFDLPEQPLYALEMDIAPLLESWGGDHLMKPISTYAPVYEDLAFVTEEETPAAKVHELILEAGQPLLREARLFDIFRGERVGAGKKSLAYALTYQAMDQTLTDKEMDVVREKIVNHLQQSIGATLRV